MATEEFYSLFDKKKVKIDEDDIEEVQRKGRTFLVGDIVIKGTKRKLWKIKPVKVKRKDGVTQRYHKRKNVGSIDSGALNSEILGARN